jgi:hypothetical protein
MKRFLTLPVILGGLALATVMTISLLVYILLVRPPAPGELPPDQAELTLIPAPTSTPHINTPTPSPIPATLTPSNTPPPGSFAVGVFVHISGTGGEGLYFRSAPGINSEPLFVAAEAEVFQITDGSQATDGYTWWFLTAPYDANRSGWAVQDYLTVIENP